MVVAMFVGMAVLGTFRSWAGLTVAFAEHPLASYVLMATDMAVGMAVWMRVRGHTWAGTVEMCAAMYLPVALFPLLALGVVDATTFMVLAHVLMILAMAALVWARRHDAHS